MKIFQANFYKLWFAQGFSEFGNQISHLAIPLYAVYFLAITPFQMGILNALEGLPILLFGLISAAYIEHLPKVKIMMLCDIGRFFLLCLLPIAYFTGFNHLFFLYVIVFLVANLTSIFNLAFWSIIPHIVESHHLTPANSRLSATTSLAETVGPSLAGIIIQKLGIPFAIFLDALTFLGSAFAIKTMVITDTTNSYQLPKITVFKNIKEGITFVLNNKILLYLMTAGLIWNYIHFTFIAVLILYFSRTLHFTATIIGIIMSAGGFGAVLGSAITTYFNKKFHAGSIMVVTQLLGIVTYALIPYIDFNFYFDVILLMFCMFITEIFSSINNVLSLSIRQKIIPEHLLVRSLATMRILTWGIIPFAAAFAGILAEIGGLKMPLYIGGVTSIIFSVIWAFRSKFWSNALN